MFKSKIIYLPKREGERFASVLTKMNFNTKVFRRKGKIKLKDYWIWSGGLLNKKRNLILPL